MFDPQRTDDPRDHLLRPGSGSSPSSSGTALSRLISNLFACTPVGAASTCSDLRRCLSTLSIIGYGLGGTLGVGIFVLVGQAARYQSGPAVCLSYGISGFSCLFSALSYAEFASRVPSAGSAYSFAYTSLGEIIAWSIGWDLTLEYSISASAVARGWASYAAAFFNEVGLPFPSALVAYKPFSLGGILESICGSEGFSFMALAIVLACGCLAITGMKESSNFTNIVTTINISAVIIMLIAGFYLFEPSNLTPFAPFGVRGILSSASFVFFSYVGFDSVSCLAEECRNPQRDLPIGIIGTLGITTLIYMMVSLVLVGMVPYSSLDILAPLSSALVSRGLPWVATIIALAAVTTTSCTVLTSIIAQPRIYYRMSRDGLVWSALGKVHPRLGTPVNACLLTSAMAGILAFMFDLDALSSMISIGTLMSFSTVCASVLVLRYQGTSSAKHANYAIFSSIALCCALSTSLLQSWSWFWSGLIGILIIGFAVYLSTLQQASFNSSFKCPYVPYVPLTGIAVNSLMLGTLSWVAWIRFALWFGVGMCIYCGYGYRHSKLRPWTQKIAAADDHHHHDDSQRLLKQAVVIEGTTS